jgi:hypothetical protein
VDLISNPKPRSTFPAKPAGASTSLPSSGEALQGGVATDSIPRELIVCCSRRSSSRPQRGRPLSSLGASPRWGSRGLPFRYWIRVGSDMRRLLAMALLLAVGAACSKQPAVTGVPAPAADPKAAATAKPAATTAPNANRAPITTGAPGSSPSANPGYAVFNQYDPPMRVLRE